MLRSLVGIQKGFTLENRTDWVDYAKAIGIILVVYGHVARGLHNAGLEVSTALFNLADSVIYSFHMPLFFFLSGLFFCNSLSKRGGKQLVFSKIDTVLYPYIVWSIFQGCIEAIFSEYTNGDISFSEVFALLWAPRAQFWFLYALFLIFVVATAIYSIVSNKFSIVVFVFSVALYLFPETLPGQRVYRFISNNLVFFSFGIIFNMYASVKGLSTAFSFLGLFLSFILAQWLFHGHLFLDYTSIGIESMLLAFISIIFVVSLSACLSRMRFSFLKFIGASSMAIYLMHVLAGSGARIIATEIFYLDSFSFNMLLGLLLGVLVPLAVLEVINRLKVPYIFAAPVSAWFVSTSNKILQRTGRIMRP